MSKKYSTNIDIYIFIGIFLGYSLLQFLEHGIAWINRIKTFYKDKQHISSQAQEGRNLVNNVHDLNISSCVLILGQEPDGSTTNGDYEK